ncbi:hypothetical protein Hanom_Chr17g01540741 [Helianthus anomalus]
MVIYSPLKKNLTHIQQATPTKVYIIFHTQINLTMRIGRDHKLTATHNYSFISYWIHSNFKTEQQQQNH